MTLHFALVFCLVAASGPPSAETPATPAQPQGTQELAVAAEAAFAAGRYENAAALYGELHTLEPDPGHLYNQAQALRLAGDDLGAADTYDRFLEDADEILNTFESEKRDQLSLMILNARLKTVQCRERFESTQPLPEPSPEVAPSPPPAEPDPSPVPPPPMSAQQPRWQRDPAAITLLATGGLLMAAGASMFVAAAVLDAKAESRPTHDDFNENIQRATVIQQVAPAPLALGAALVVGGAIRYGLLRRRALDQRIDVAVSASPSSGLATARLRF